MTFIERIRLFIRSRRGVTAIEYGILAAGVAIVIGALVSSDGPLATLKSSKAPTNYFTPNILRKSWSRLVVSVVHLDALAFPVAAT